MEVSAKLSTIELGSYYEKFIEDKISSGKFLSAGEVIRTALRLLEINENNKNLLVNELELGEASGFVENFDRDNYLKQIQSKHLRNEN